MKVSREEYNQYQAKNIKDKEEMSIIPWLLIAVPVGFITYFLGFPLGGPIAAISLLILIVIVPAYLIFVAPHKVLMKFKILIYGLETEEEYKARLNDSKKR